LGKTIIIHRALPGEECGDALHPTAAASSLCGGMVPCPCARADGSDSAGYPGHGGGPKSPVLMGF